MMWPVETIDAVAQVNPRLAAADRPNMDELVCFVPMAAVSEETLSIRAQAERPFSEVATGYTPFKRGDVLVAKITPSFENGKMALADNLAHELGFGTTEFHVFRPSERITGSYLFNLLRAPYVRKAGAIKMQGAADQRRVPADFFAALRVPLPPLAEQKRIAGILDAADALRTKRRETLVQLDALLQSTFLDMFGDPVINPMGWRVGRLEDFFSKTTRAGTCCGPFGSALKKQEYVDDGVPVWGIENVKPNQFIQEGSHFITPEKFAELRRYSVESGDILISRAGTVGRMCVAVPTVEQSIIGTNLIRLTLDPGAMSPVFFASLYTFCGERLPALRASGDDRAYSFLNTTRLKSLVVPLPPLDLQHRFATIVESVEQQKTTQRAHLAELDTLFASLQSRAFRGDL